MKLVLMAALISCLFAVWPLRHEVHGLWPYLLAQLMANAACFLALCFGDEESNTYFATYAGARVLSTAGALIVAAYMLKRYSWEGWLLATLSALAIAVLPTLWVHWNLRVPWRGAVPIEQCAVLCYACLTLFCGAIALLTGLPPTLKPFAAWTHAILGLLWLWMGLWGLVSTIGFAKLSWRNAVTVLNLHLPIWAQVIAFALLFAMAKLQAEVGHIGTTEPEVELAVAREMAQ